ncbi:MAG: hypothetical protein MUF71_08690 [Candidatus Kapabacteria bacterium]|jgi:hypothetical protein|nr:hypothetical protein [Candidatus Kapabacteria bacterium]
MTEVEVKMQVTDIITKLVFTKHREAYSDALEVRVDWCYEGEAANAPIPLWHISAGIFVETPTQKYALEEGRRKLISAAEQAIKRYVNDAVYLQLSINLYPEITEYHQNYEKIKPNTHSKTRRIQANTR